MSRYLAVVLAVPLAIFVQSAFAAETIDVRLSASGAHTVTAIPGSVFNLDVWANAEEFLESTLLLLESSDAAAFVLHDASASFPWKWVPATTTPGPLGSSRLLQIVTGDFGAAEPPGHYLLGSIAMQVNPVASLGKFELRYQAAFLEDRQGGSIRRTPVPVQPVLVEIVPEPAAGMCMLGLLWGAPHILRSRCRNQTG